MKRQITPKEIIYKEDFTKVTSEKNDILEYADICISEDGLNVEQTVDALVEKLQVANNNIGKDE